jgi:hypothetical protein
VSSESRFDKIESVAWTDVKILCPCLRALAVISYVENTALNLLSTVALVRLIDCTHYIVNGFVMIAV